MTIGHAGRAIRSYELFTGYKSFKTSSSKQAVAFCNHVADCSSPTTGKPLSLSTRHSTLALLRSFFSWLSVQPGCRKAIIASIKLKHIDLEENVARLAAGEMSTKGSKTFDVWFFPVDPMMRGIVASWVRYLREEQASSMRTRCSLLRPRSWGRGCSSPTTACRGPIG